MDRDISEITKLTERIAKDPKSKLFVPLAEEYKKLGDIEMSIHVLTEGLKNNPGYVTARSFLGRLLIETGDLTGAQKEFEEVIRAIPDNLLGQRKLGDIYALQGRIEDALTCYRSAVKLSPKDNEILALIEDLESGRDITPKIGKPRAQQAADQAPQIVHEETSPEPAHQPAPAGSAGPEPREKTVPVPPTFPAPEEEVAEEVLVVQPLDEEPVLAAPEPVPSGFDFLSEGKIEAGEGPIPGLEVSVPGGFFEDAPFVVPEPGTESESGVSSGKEADAESESPALPPIPEFDEASSEVINKSDDFTTDTLAELYISQGFYEKAIDIYDRMLAENPGHQGLRDKLARLHALAEEAGGGEQTGAQKPQGEAVQAVPEFDLGAGSEAGSDETMDDAGGAFFAPASDEEQPEALPADVAYDVGEPFGQQQFGAVEPEAKEYVPPPPSREEEAEVLPSFDGGFDLSEKSAQEPMEEEIEIEADVLPAPPTGIVPPGPAPFKPQAVEYEPFQTEPERFAPPERQAAKSVKDTRKETITRLELWLKNIAKEK